jgi:hypothetical protein
MLASVSFIVILINKYSPLIVHILNTKHANLNKTETGFRAVTFECSTSSHEMIFIHFGGLITLCCTGDVHPFCSALEPLHGFQLNSIREVCTESLVMLVLTSLGLLEPLIIPLTPELNSSAQRGLTRFFTGDFTS